MEFLNHVLGTCGEFHPNIFTVCLVFLVLGRFALKTKESH